MLEQDSEVCLIFPLLYFTNFNTDNVRKFLPEVWALYGIGMAVLLLRFVTRLKTVGLKGFQGDDYMSILTIAFFTAGVTAVHIICRSPERVKSMNGC